MTAIVRITQDAGADKRSPEDWGKMVHHRLVSTIQSIVQAGQLLEDAVKEFKKQEGHWKHKYSVMLKSARIDQPFAHRLRKVATHPILGTNLYEASLPPHASILGELASIPEDKMLPLIKSKAIHPEMKQAEVRKLKSNHVSTHGSPAKTAEPEQSSLDMAHDVYLELKPKLFREEIGNLICDKKGVTIQSVIDYLESIK